MSVVVCRIVVVVCKIPSTDIVYVSVLIVVDAVAARGLARRPARREALRTPAMWWFSLFPFLVGPCAALARSDDKLVTP